MATRDKKGRRVIGDIRPWCKVCGKRWVPKEGMDASAVPCGPCRRRLGLSVSKNGWVLYLDDTAVWAEVRGDSGQCFIGRARCGAHHYRTEGWYPTRVGALVAGLGLLAAHLANVAAEHGDKDTFGREAPPKKRRVQR
jgi:hypothetical protein